jgi:hypothetical protein
MKHPARHVSRSVRKVSHGRRQASRQVSVALEKIKNDPSFQQLLRELAKRAVEIAIRILIISAANRCLRSGGEQAQVVPFRPKPIS